MSRMKQKTITAKTNSQPPKQNGNHCHSVLSIKTSVLTAADASPQWSAPVFCTTGFESLCF